MRRDPKNSDDFRKSNMESLGAVYRSFNQLNQSLTKFSTNAFNRTIETQAELAKKAYESYIAEASRLGQMFLTGSGRFVVPEEQRALDVTTNAASSSNAAPQRTAAQRMTNQRKSGAAKRPSRGKRSKKAKA
jgi:hypothetical protein